MQLFEAGNFVCNVVVSCAQPLRVDSQLVVHEEKIKETFANSFPMIELLHVWFVQESADVLSAMLNKTGWGSSVTSVVVTITYAAQ